MTKKADANVPAYVRRLIKKYRMGIKLDVGCGSNKQKGFIGLDIRKIPGVDIVQNAEIVPYPLPSECCTIVLASHLIEHMCPKNMINVVNEWWRIMRPGGQLWISMPYGTSFGYHQDPTHCASRNEATWSYFNPAHELYSIYQPKPWRIIKVEAWHHGNMEVIMEKMTEREGAQCQVKK